MGKLALVLSAGGARGAYEAGVLNYLRSALPAAAAKVSFPIQTGTSVGAINAATWVSMAEDPAKQGERLKELWFSLGQENIYRRDFGALLNLFNNSVRGILSNLITVDPMKLFRRKGPHFVSLLDTTPLAKLLKKSIPFKNIPKNISSGPVDALAIGTTNLNTGHPEIFLQKKNVIPFTGKFKIHEGEIGLDEVMASSAIPLIFPNVKIGKHYYADGGLRLFTPMSPALHLGADRLLIVGLRHQPERMKKKRKVKKKRVPITPPSVAQNLGRILNGFFLDHLQNDLEQLERINQIIEIGTKEFGKGFLDKLNQRIEKEGEQSYFAHHQLKTVRVLEIFPSQYISSLFLKWYRRARKEDFKFSAFEKFVIRILDIDPLTGKDLLSYLTFAPSFLKDLFELGFRDAESHRNEILELYEDDGSP